MTVPKTPAATMSAVSRPLLGALLFAFAAPFDTDGGAAVVAAADGNGAGRGVAGVGGADVVGVAKGRIVVVGVGAASPAKRVRASA